MIALSDLGLFILSAESWSRDRERYAVPADALLLHEQYLRSYPVRLLWSDDFFLGFPWNQPSCPPEFFEQCVAMTRLYEVLRGQARLITPEALGKVNQTLPTIEPDLVAEDLDYPPDLRGIWLALLSGALSEKRHVAEGMAIPTWTGAHVGAARELLVTNAAACAAQVARLPLLLTEADWRTFLETFHRPDLHGRRVAILGGSRAPFERARERLATYGLQDCRRLPPGYEEHRTAQVTKERLQAVDLLVICTNRLKHADTYQVDSIRADLSCVIVHLANDSETQLVKTIVDHYRRLEEQDADIPAGRP